MAKVKKTATKSATPKKKASAAKKKPAAPKTAKTKTAKTKTAKTKTAKTKTVSKAGKSKLKKVIASATKKAAQKGSSVTKQTRRTVKKTASVIRTKTKRTTKAKVNLEALFAPLTEGECADSLRYLLEEDRLGSMAKVGRYQIITIEPLLLKTMLHTPDRLVRIVAYDYSSVRTVEANVNLTQKTVEDLRFSNAQPMLSREEEQRAMEIAIADDGLRARLSLGDSPQVTMHYWSQKPTDLAHNRRSAAVLFGQPNDRPSIVAIVDFLEAEVTDIVPAALW